MTGFRGIRFVKDLWIRFGTKRESLNSKELNNNEPDKQEPVAANTLSIFKKHKWTFMYGVSTLVLVSVITIAGHQYVERNIVEVYHVSVDGEEVGTVSSSKLIEDFKNSKKLEAESSFPNVRMIVDTNKVTYKTERAYKLKSDDQAVLAALNERIIPQAIGTELKVDGKVIAIVKDQATADLILAKVQEPYTPKSKESGKVGVLSSDSLADLDSAPSTLEKIEFVQSVETGDVPIDPDELADPDEVVEKLMTGDIQPTKYKVVEGDCVGCIAKKFGISRQFIYEKNSWIKDDMIKIGDELDLTVLQPTLSVKTTEHVVQNQEIQYDTEYIKDDSLRLGVVQTISPGKNGLKQVTYEVTKVNGLMMEESLLNEEIIEDPVTAKAKKGTKVVLGEGTGKFAWPVVSANISSTYGIRWGKMHKGIDITGNKNILAADNGKVKETGYKSDYGNYIIVDHLNGFQTLYGHLSKIGTSKGKIVEKGERIGTMGSTGDSTGVHLHFEIIKSGSVQNPLKYLSR